MKVAFLFVGLLLIASVMSVQMYGVISQPKGTTFLQNTIEITPKGEFETVTTFAKYYLGGAEYLGISCFDREHRIGYWALDFLSGIVYSTDFKSKVQLPMMVFLSKYVQALSCKGGAVYATGLFQLQNKTVIDALVRLDDNEFQMVSVLPKSITGIGRITSFLEGNTMYYAGIQTIRPSFNFTIGSINVDTGEIQEPIQVHCAGDDVLPEVIVYHKGKLFTIFESLKDKRIIYQVGSFDPKTGECFGVHPIDVSGILAGYDFLKDGDKVTLYASFQTNQGSYIATIDADSGKLVDKMNVVQAPIDLFVSA